MTDNSSPAVAAPNPPKAQLLLQLAARCEREEPSDELWHAIARALGWTWELDGRLTYWMTPEGDIWNLPDWLRSLDAAVTLVPEGFYWSLDYDCCAHVVGFEDKDGNVPVGHSDAAAETDTPALALCAAALRARAATQAPEEGE